MKIKNIRISTILVAAAILCVGLSALAQKRTFPEPPPFVNPTGDEMMISATLAFSQPELMTREKYLELKECGFNMGSAYMYARVVDQALEAMEGTGIKMALACWEALDTNKMESVLAKYRDNPLIGRINVADEPTVSKFQKVKKIKDKMEALNLPYMTTINLLPEVAPEQMEAPDYRTYVEEFVSTVNPPFLSFDCYPISARKDGSVTVYKNYYNTLEVISDVARKSNRPFFAYVLCNQHRSYPKPTRDFLRFQIFSQLAYGVQGLSFYTYCIPDYDKNDDYRNAPLDKQGNKTDVWYMVRDVLKEFKNVENIFFGAEVLDVNHTGSNIPKGTKRLGNKNIPAPFKNISSSGEGVIVSHLKNGENEYLMFVNRDVVNRQKVNFDLSRPVIRVTPQGRKRRENSRSVNLTPGGYAIYKLND